METKNNGYREGISATKRTRQKLTKKRFCNEYLGKSESYHVMKYLNKEASNDALLKCYVGLKKAADELEENGFKNINYHNNKRLADMLAEIEDKVEEI